MSTCACGQPVGDALACTGCARRLELCLGDVPALCDDLDVVLSRQTAYSEVTARVTGTTETPVMFDVTASDAATALRAVITSWVRIVMDERYGTPCLLRAYPADTVQACSRWLLGRPVRGEQTEVEWIRHQAWAMEAIDNITDAVRHVRHVLDAPTNRTTFNVGPCPEPGCPGEVRAFIPRDEDKPGYLTCTAAEEHHWDSTQMLRLGKRMLKAGTV